jgi:site-specific DNA recombinase
VSVLIEPVAIAAIYARKSTDQAVADESKSVTRQVEHARQYAVTKGWTVDDGSIFVDDGISGAEFDRRPGFVRLMDAVKHPTFNVLIMSESSRLGREAWETGYALKRLLKAGVRVFLYLEDRECTVDTPTDKLMFSVLQGVDEMHRALASQRSVDKALQLARAGHVTGGRVFGYDNVRIDSHTERRINETEAAVVRRIFELAAVGVGQKRITLLLNEESAPAPRAQQGRPTAWAHSSVHEVLFRELYRGSIVWNRTRKRNRWGEKEWSDRPATDWLTVEAPQLRIVDEDLWTTAHGRIASSRQPGGPLPVGRPKTREPRYLLTGFARCSCCNGGLHVRSQQGGSPGRRIRARFYACTTHFSRGRTVCGNDLRLRIETIDQAVMDRIGEILTPSLADEVIVAVRELLERHEADPRAAADSDLAALERQIANLTDAVAMGGNLRALVARLQQLEEARNLLAMQREALPPASRLIKLDWRALERQAREKLASWRSLATRHVADGRKLLESLLDGPIVFTPFEESGARGYRFRGHAVLTGLIEGVAAVVRLSSPKYGEIWRPHRDSNPGFSLERAAS